MDISKYWRKWAWPRGSFSASSCHRSPDNRFRRPRFESLEQRRVLASITVLPGLDTIPAAVAAANDGDTLVLKPGMYQVSRTVEISENLTIKAFSSDPSKVNVSPVSSGFVGDHIFSALPAADNVTFANFTVTGAPDFGLTPEECGCENPTEENGDGIHIDGVEMVRIANVRANRNGGNGIFIVGAASAVLTNIIASNNGAFGIDVDTALNLRLNGAVLNNNGISGMEASGHDSPDVAFTAVVSIMNTIATNNGEIGVEIERFNRATLTRVACLRNVEDGFDADRVNNLAISDSAFSFNGDDGIEMFLVPNRTFKNLKIVGNEGMRINTPPTED